MFLSPPGRGRPPLSSDFVSHFPHFIGGIYFLSHARGWILMTRKAFVKHPLIREKSFSLSFSIFFLSIYSIGKLHIFKTLKSDLKRMKYQINGLQVVFLFLSSPLCGAKTWFFLFCQTQTFLRFFPCPSSLQGQNDKKGFPALPQLTRHPEPTTLPGLRRI